MEGASFTMAILDNRKTAHKWQPDRLSGIVIQLCQIPARWGVSGNICGIKETLDRGVSSAGICPRRNIFKDKRQDVSSEVRGNLIEQTIKCGIPGDVDEKAALIWLAVSESVSTDIGNYLLSPHYVSAILSRFEAAMKRWRCDSDKLKNPIRWPIVSEREVQDILYLVLRSYFDDLIDEEAMPKFGHKFHKPDFAIPSLRLLIEVKYAYQKDDFKKARAGDNG